MATIVACQAPSPTDSPIGHFKVMTGATPTPTPTPTCPPCGPYTNFTQGGYGQNPNGNNVGAFLAANFNTLTGGTLNVGIDNTLTFTSAAAVAAFLPTGGTPGVLTGDIVNPTGTTSAGVLAGQVITLKLNVLKNAGLGGQVIQGLNITVNQLLLVAEIVLGGNTAILGPYSVSQLNDLVSSINEGTAPLFCPNGTFD